uniref:Uncharacterized protein n=1 Tax=Oryza glumipatula TaxID=40148 RepID=A0A0D9Y754_9ORYZ
MGVPDEEEAAARRRKMAAAPNFVVGAGGRGGQICRRAPARLPPPSSPPAHRPLPPGAVPDRLPPTRSPSSSSATEPSAVELLRRRALRRRILRRFRRPALTVFSRALGGGGRGGCGVAVPRGAAARSWQEQRRCPHKTSATNTLSPIYATRCGEGGGWSGGEVASDDGVRSWGKEEDKATEEKTVTLRIESGGKVFFFP